MQRDQAHRTNELLERIAKALEVGNVTKAKEISGENTGELTAKSILDSVKVITDDYASKKVCKCCNNENQHGKVDKCVCQDDGGDGYYTTDEKGERNFPKVERNSVQSIVDVLDNHLLLPESEIHRRAFGYDRSTSYGSNKKYADMLRRGLRKGLYKRVNLGKGASSKYPQSEYFYFTNYFKQC